MPGGIKPIFYSHNPDANISREKIALGQYREK